MSRGMTLTIRSLYGWDDSLFDDMRLPGSLDRDTVIAAIMMRCQDLELLYPDWGYMRQAVAYWSAAEFWGWEKLAKTLSMEYDPIYNYDRREEWTDDADESVKGSASGSAAAFNAGSMTERERQASESSAKRGSKHKGRVYGNIGVTTTQQLIESERDLSRWSIYNEIAESFAARFCLFVY